MLDKPTHEMACRLIPCTSRPIAEAASDKEGHRHADTFRWHRPGKMTFHLVTHGEAGEVFVRNSGRCCHSTRTCKSLRSDWRLGWTNRGIANRGSLFLTLGGSDRCKLDYIRIFRDPRNGDKPLILNGRGERIRISVPLVPNQFQRFVEIC